jgi:uncharacterized protein
MVTGEVRESICGYLREARRHGMQISRAVLFGSRTRDVYRDDSDIDLVVISPQLEPPVSWAQVAKLWELRASTDIRIEPIPCGEREWETDDSRMILEIARREGVVVE